MGNWEATLREIDDDYLVGISNKGIVKRAYKDMETISCKIAGELFSEAPQTTLQEVFATDGEIAVNVGEETVHIIMPLGDSTCSCPSRSICRHVVLGILALKEAVVKAGTDSIDSISEDGASEDTLGQMNNSITERNKKEFNEKEVSEKEVSKKEALKKQITKFNQESEEKICNSSQAKDIHKTQDADTGLQQSDNSLTIKITQQIAEYPTEKLCKKLGIRRLQELIGCAKAGKGPQIHYASVVTVQPIAKSMIVKLLFPLEYSTCTCHKKEFCMHKAEAILWCKLESGQIHICDLEQGQADNVDYDMDQVRDVVFQMQAFLGELLDTGLSRTPQDALDHMERLATICHNAKLPNFEGDWRRLQDSYNKYLKRVASLGIQMLMRQITTLYSRTELLAQAQDGLEVSKLAGAFRAEYTPELDLDLVGIAAEHFISKSGYEGDTVYFLEKNTKQWYTYTQARPVFYDNAAISSNRRYAQETPWGLPVSLMDLAFWQLHLEQAKCDERGRLSASKDTKGQLVQDRRSQNTLTTEVLGKWYYQDFAQLFKEQFLADWNMPEMDGTSEAVDSYAAESETGRQTKLVFLCPASCDPAVFEETQQKLCMNLYDEAGKVVVVEIVYSREESEGIQYLENITNENLPSFFGKVYFRNGIIRMYPVAVFEKKDFAGEADKEWNQDGNG